MIQAALIGVSGFGRVHYTDLLRHHERGDLKLVAATVINPHEEQDKCATLEKLGCRLFDDYTHMLEDFSGQLDLCCIPTGIGMHAPMAIRAMSHGANCLIEKPAAPCIQDVRAMQAKELETGKFVAVGFQSIFQPEVQQIKQDIMQGRLGRIRCVKGIGLWPRNSAYYGRNNWAGRIRNDSGWILDSPFNNALAHYVNLCCFFAGTTFEDSAELDCIQACLFRCNPEIENADSAVMHLKTTNHVDILFYTTHSCDENYGPVIEIEGDQGTIQWTPKEATYTRLDGSRKTLPINEQVMRENLMNALLERCVDASRFICDLSIAERHVLAVNGAHESSPILPVDPDVVERRSMDGGAHRYVYPGIDDIFKTLFEREEMTSPDAPWMKPGDKISLQHYTEFTGGRTGVL